MKIKSIKEAPIAVQTAFTEVKASFPEVVSVEFDSELCWCYRYANGFAPGFDDNIDVSLLEDAADSIDEFPVKYMDTKE